ncbi:hypothetical protein BCR41DRAFT_211536 [Lobosporangium transversale]|uniref:Uncharacterized protein n=1 Tax=Lobosporangium transversale TaxID=64571 RepID=A0A1Y2G7L6_9FUNG|nr:hypothetical protein BCR41DRAFT_211536 [Lobosporangium transversale]ORZ00008.1 hypothetical protein BCR41DRAFT_211536 [Lobosporangium transversale]|eukprot:XP_021876049.1 hypothetical protein BCR41DRAFT_211536 [Lobosporangium transversale]
MTLCMSGMKRIHLFCVAAPETAPVSLSYSYSCIFIPCSCSLYRTIHTLFLCMLPIRVPVKIHPIATITITIIISSPVCLHFFFFTQHWLIIVYISCSAGLGGYIFLVCIYASQINLTRFFFQFRPIWKQERRKSNFVIFLAQYH